MARGLSKGIDEILRKLEKEEIKIPPSKLSELEYQQQLYLSMKKAWYFHDSSWYMRHDNGYYGKGCNDGIWVPECPRFPAKGRMLKVGDTWEVIYDD
ncbi:MAG: hypothetical protein MN733_18370 [Nitrososphaera sp.]|nr:hypothetical protein [Nitrososphaera sp.]